MHDRTIVTIENTKGIDNSNDIKDVTSSGGWGYFSNSEIHFKRLLQIIITVIMLEVINIYIKYYLYYYLY